jgi:glucose/arabinose dehydrogenase
MGWTAVGAGVFFAATLSGQVRLPLDSPGEATPNFGSVVERPAGADLSAPAGFTVTEFATGIEAPRMMRYAPNGDLFVSQSARNVITILRDGNGDGTSDARFVYAQGPEPPRGRRGGGPPPDVGGDTCVAEGQTGGRQPFGMAFHDGYLYVGYTNCLVRYRYAPGDTAPQAAAEELVRYPGGGNYTRNVAIRPDGQKLYVAIGSQSNNSDGEDERRAAINDYNLDGSGHRIFASGIRNPVGLAFRPGTNELWTAVNERDGLGDDLVPDYATSVRDGGFYGWPYSYIGQNYDPAHEGKMPDLVKRAIVPDVLIQAHSAALGITFYTGTQFPQRYRNGAFVALHGSWNRSTTAGVKVIFIPFADGKPGAVEDFLTGFVVSPQENSKWGRPVGVTVAPDGALLVSDDEGNKVWRVSYSG